MIYIVDYIDNKNGLYNIHIHMKVCSFCCHFVEDASFYAQFD